MCMITYVPANVDIPVQGIKNGAIINDDGHGWVVAVGDTMLVGKSMKFEEALDAMLAAREELGMGALAMFHSRYGTHGEMGEYNIHPFYVGEGDGSVMAHNGILPSKYHPHYKDRRSDTRIFVDRIAGYVDNPNGVPSRRGAARLGRMINDGNKLVFISVKSGMPKVRIVNADAGIQVDGVWYSNSGYLTDYSWYGLSANQRTHKIGGLRTGWDSDMWDYYDERVTDVSGKEVQIYSGGGDANPSGAPEICPNCQSMDVDAELGICLECVTCLDCHDNYSYCLCWRPGGKFAERNWGEKWQGQAQQRVADAAAAAEIEAEADAAWANTPQGKWERENIPTIG